jgi:hypothetical protein
LREAAAVDPYEPLRRAAVHALGQFAASCGVLPDALVRALEDEDRTGRRHALESVGRLGCRAQPAEPVLLRMLARRS